jgi:hypothetical protein
MADTSGPVDIKGHLDAADSVVDTLPWQLGETEAQRKRSRGRVAALAHQIAALIAGGWTTDDIRAALAGAETASSAPDAGAQERQWRAALKRAKHARQQADRPSWKPSGDAAAAACDA